MLPCLANAVMRDRPPAALGLMSPHSNVSASGSCLSLNLAYDSLPPVMLTPPMIVFQRHGASGATLRHPKAAKSCQSQSPAMRRIINIVVRKRLYREYSTFSYPSASEALA